MCHPSCIHSLQNALTNIPQHLPLSSFGKGTKGIQSSIKILIFIPYQTPCYKVKEQCHRYIVSGLHVSSRSIPADPYCTCESLNRDKESESDRDLLPRRILHQRGVCLDEDGACIEDNNQTMTIIYTI